MHLLLSPKILGPVVVGVREDIVNMHDAAVQNGSPRRRPAILANRISLNDFDKFRRMAIADRNPINSAILSVDEALVSVAKPDRIVQHVLQGRLEVERRAAGDLEDFAGRGLLLQRFGELLPSLGEFAPASFKLLLQRGVGFALATRARSRLRSGRTKLATLRLAFRALARQGHPRSTSIDPRLSWLPTPQP